MPTQQDFASAYRDQLGWMLHAPTELERLLVEQATSALGRGQGADALAACVEHQRRFPSGRLAEERERVAIGARAAHLMARSMA